MTEHITEDVDAEVAAIIDLTADQPSEPAQRAEPTIDLTVERSEVPTEAADEPAADNADDADDADDTDDTVDQAAELIEQIDAEVEAAAEQVQAAEAEQVEDTAEAAPVAQPVEEPAPPALDIPLRRVLEAVLLVAEDPLPVVEIATRLEVPAPEVETAIRELAAEYEQQERGFALREIAGGWRYYTAAECAPEVERFLLAGQTSRLSQAALETLAVVAYQQPVSRSRIAAVRGVSVDGVIKTLVSRGLIAESGTDSESGAIMYVTTPKFLERLGLRDLSELPPLAPLLPGLDELPEE